MRVRRLELCGFKSFCERTVFQFADGISGVVGPNGCGKSNVLDAIRWLLGERNPRLLRGQGMEDVIFSGSASKAATGVAEATLVFDNTDGSLGGKYARFTEIEVSRRLYRDGESQYLINRTRCRRKDVVDLFMDTGVGARASSVIEQGKVTDLINSKPEGRRTLIEEAAGIVGYKSRRQEAQRRLDATEQNLLRVGDRVDELRKRMNALKRQAQKANRYRRLRAFRKETEVLLALARTREITGTYRQWMDTQADLEGVRGRHDEELKTMQLQLEAQREQLRNAEAGVDELKERQAHVRATVQGKDRQREFAEQEIEHLQRQAEELAQEVETARSRSESLVGEEEGLRREEQACLAEAEQRRSQQDERRAELDGFAAELEGLLGALEELQRADMESVSEGVRLRSRIEGLERSGADLRLRGDVLQQERDDASQRLEQARVRQGELSDQVRQREEDLDAGRAHLVDLDEELESRNAAWAEVMATLKELGDLIRERAARQRSLDDVLARFEGFDRAVREVMQKRQAEGDASGILGTVADVIVAPAELEQATEAALGRAVEFVLVESMDHGRSALDYLRERGGGRTSFLPLDRLRPEVTEALDEPGVVGRLLDLVQVEPSYRPVAQLLLGDAVVVESLDDALRLYDEVGPRARLVTRDGTVVDAGGVVTGGDVQQGGVLGQKRELRQLEAELGDLRREEATARGGAEAISEEIERLTGRKREAEAALQQGEIERARLDGDLHAAEKDVGDATRRVEGVDRERAGLQERLDALAAEERASREQLEVAEAGHRQLQEQLAEAEVRVRELRQRQQQQQDRAHQADLEAAAASARLQSVRERIEQTARTRDEVRERIERDRTQRTRMEERAKEFRGQIEQLRTDSEDAAKELEELGAMVHEAMEHRKGLAAERARLDSALDGLRGKVAGAEQQLQEARTQVAVLDERLKQIRDELRRDFDLDLRQIFADIEREGEVEVVLRGTLPRPLGEDDTEEAQADAGPEEQAASGRPAEAPAAMGIPIQLSWSQLLDDELLIERRQKLEKARRDLERIGDINAAAPEEYEEVKEQHSTLVTQMRDLEDSMAQIRQAIKKLNRTSRERFSEAFEAVDAQFRELYPRLTGGGRAELSLTDPEDLLETGVEIRVQPPGKKLTAMGLLSGGEKAMAALSLVFSVFLYRPSPFCLLDEVDAELDEANVQRFNQLLKEMSERTQFIVITHTRKTMESANVLFGVTMEKPGISKLVTVKLDEVAA